MVIHRTEQTIYHHAEHWSIMQISVSLNPSIWLTILSQSIILSWLIITTSLVGWRIWCFLSSRWRTSLSSSLNWIDFAMSEWVLLNSLVWLAILSKTTVFCWLVIRHFDVGCLSLVKYVWKLLFELDVEDGSGLIKDNWTLDSIYVLFGQGHSYCQWISKQSSMTRWVYASDRVNGRNTVPSGILTTSSVLFWDRKNTAIVQSTADRLTITLTFHVPDGWSNTVPGITSTLTRSSERHNRDLTTIPDQIYLTLG